MRRFLIMAATMLAPALSLAYIDTSYYDAGSNTFVCASTTSVVGTATQAGASAAAAPIALYNPPGSKTKLVVKDVSIMPTSSPAAAVTYTLAYTVAPSTSITGGTPGNMTSAFVGTSTSTLTTVSVATCTVGGTLPATPIPFRILGGTTGASAIGGVQIVDYIPMGSVVVGPGGLIAIQATAASNILAHITWKEVPY